MGDNEAMDFIKDITKVRFCIVSSAEDGTQVLGDYDMTDWDSGWEVVWADAQKTGMDLESANVMRIDQAMDLWLDLQVMLEADGTYKLEEFYD